MGRDSRTRHNRQLENPSPQGEGRRQLQPTPENPGRWRVLGRRLAYWAGFALVAWIAASAVIFTAVELTPGDPISLRMKSPDPERIAAIRADLGLEDGRMTRYGRYLSRFVRGDWGESLITGRSTRASVGAFLPATLELALGAVLLGTLGGILLSLAAPWSGWGVLDRLTRMVGALGLTVPIFWIGLLLIAAFSYQLGWFPVGGRFDHRYVLPSQSGFLLPMTLWRGQWNEAGMILQHLALPVATLALYPMALVCGVLHGRLADPRVTALVRALRARGYGGIRIWLGHVLRLQGAPIATVLGTHAGALFGGAVLTEVVFSWPGMGRFLVEAVLNRDLFVVENALLLVVLLSVVTVSVADLFASWLNPLSDWEEGADG